jgi:hypothetical protein
MFFPAPRVDKREPAIAITMLVIAALAVLLVTALVP